MEVDSPLTLGPNTEDQPAAVLTNTLSLAQHDLKSRVESLRMQVRTSRTSATPRWDSNTTYGITGTCMLCMLCGPNSVMTP